VSVIVLVTDPSRDVETVASGCGCCNPASKSAATIAAVGGTTAASSMAPAGGASLITPASLTSLGSAQ
jgi:hypothetical protein